MHAVFAGRPERAVPRLLTQAVVFPAALSAIVALVLVGEVRALISLSRWVQHTDQVIDSAHQLERILIDRESAFRGFMNVPREEFLAPYTRTSSLVGETWSQLIQFVADNPPQQARLTRGARRSPPCSSTCSASGGRSTTRGRVRSWRSSSRRRCGRPGGWVR